MAGTQILDEARTERPVTRQRGGGTLLRRLPAVGIGLTGSMVLLEGVSLPWVSTFAGLIKQSGWGTRNGNILMAMAIVSAIVAVAHLVVGTASLRWLLALVGFAATGYAGYLLIQLYSVAQQSDTMTLLDKGPGLYVAAAGAALVFCTIFLPMPRDVSLAIPEVPPTGPALRRPLLSPLTSRLRYPTAALAVVVGLAHVPVTPEHLREAPYIGVSFMVLTTACIALAAALLVWDAPLVWFLLAGACLLAVVAFVVSRTVGLPLLADDVGNWSETLGIVAVLTETCIVVTSAVVIGTRYPRSEWPTGRWGALQQRMRVPGRSA